MSRVLFFIVVVAAGLIAGGCVFHFSGENLELDAERQRIQNESFYRFEGMELSLVDYRK